MRNILKNKKAEILIGENGYEIPERVKKEVALDKTMRPYPAIVLGIGVLIMLLQWTLGLNLMAVIGAIFMVFLSFAICVEVVAKKRLRLWLLAAYTAVSFGIATFYIFEGADAGWGAFTSGLTGFFTGDHPLWQGNGNFGTRLVGNVLISAPAFLIILGLYFSVTRIRAKDNAEIVVKNAVSALISVLLVGMSVTFIFIMNLRANPRVFDMSAGQDEYLNNVKKNVSKDSPNVLVIMMDDLGYGDTSYNARKAGITPAFETPNIDSIAEEGIDFDNFYSSYSVCSPARFAFMTGRYPYRGYADNVIYPTVNTISPFSSTRYFNAIELGANADGMLGDEVTLAESFKAAGYSTGLFGKWHLGDYGQYLPTNQGFDYFYGSHHVNDMTPFYHSTEEGSEYQIDVGTNDLDQSDATRLIHDKTAQWITDKANNNEKFFAYYATPWPHAPVYAGYDYQGKTGGGIYADCVTEFDSYLGKLFDTMEELGVLDDTIIMFTSDNGPALQGSANELRGGKYSPYEAGQKLPFYMRWGNNDLYNKHRTINAPATLVDLFPTLTELAGITNKEGTINGYMPSHVDREIDGVSMVPLLNGTKDFIHDKEHPILHMKREVIQAVQYSLTKEEVLASVSGYSQSSTHALQTGNAADYADMPFIRDNVFTTWKYFKKYKNDNPEFFDKTRRNWLFCLTDDTSESYQRADVFPGIADDLSDTLTKWKNKFKDNRRGIYSEYYKK